MVSRRGFFGALAGLPMLAAVKPPAPVVEVSISADDWAAEFWRGRSLPGGDITWTVASGDVVSTSYVQRGRELTLLAPELIW